MSRFERLHKHLQADIDALPDRPTSPEPAAPAPAVSDDEEGGISLEGLSMDNPPTPTPASKPLDADPSASPKAVPAPAPIKAEQIPDVSTPANLDRRFVVMENAVSAYKPIPMANSTATPKPVSGAALPPPAPLADSGLQQGGLASATDHYAPILALAKYPYKFCNKTDMQAVATASFDAGKFWNREWDLYYVRDLEKSTVYVLVKESQFQQLLDEVNQKVKLDLHITDAQRQEGLVTRYPDHPRCLPRYLGRSCSKEEYEGLRENALQEKFPEPQDHEAGTLTSGTQEDFKELFTKLQDAQSNKGKFKSQKAYTERLGRQLSMLDQFKRAQRYLGLRSSEATAKASRIDQSSPAPYAFDQSIVFISVDVESYERAHHKITEIGVATLDTRDLVDVPPGADGVDWQPLLKARHFRIEEHKHLINHEFVAGHPEGFRFGKSTFVRLKDAPAYVGACFKQPFGVHTSNTPVETIESMVQEIDLDEKRKIILIGHDTISDVRYLQQLGFDPLKVDNILEALDTAKIYQAWRREQNPTSLGRLLSNFGIPAYGLHNAGNDAVYTIWAMLATCVREGTIRNTPALEAMRKEDKAMREAAAHESTVQRVKEGIESWNEIDDKTNGGDPVSLNSL